MKPDGYTYVRHPNEKLRAARLRLPSPTGSGRHMSRQELADAVNIHLILKFGAKRAINGEYVGQWERGVYRWPDRSYRDALRAVLGANTDAELGLYIRRRQTVETNET